MNGLLEGILSPSEGEAVDNMSLLNANLGFGNTECVADDEAQF